MAPRMKGKRGLIVLSSVVLIAAGAVTIKTRSGDGPGNSTRPEDPPSAVGETAKDRAPLLSVSPKEVSFEVPQHSYVSYFDSRLDGHRKPEPLDAGPLTLRKSNETIGQIAIFVTDQDKKIKDVMVLGNFVTKDQVGNLQWLMSKDGVELAWNAENFSDWTVERSETPLTTEGDGHYFDPAPVVQPTRYVVSHVEQVEVEVGGEKVMADKPITYVALMPLYDDSLIGKHIDTIGSQKSPGLVPRQPASTAKGAAAQERALFVEWNSFIPDDFIDAPGLCLQNVFLGFDLFKGDDRSFLDSPASEGFTARGTPRSRMSTRVGAAWSLADPDADLNAERFDDWLFRAVGTTSAHDTSEKLLTAANTGLAGFELLESRSDDDSAWRLVKGSEDDPLCSLPDPLTGQATPAPSIDYEYSFNVARDGTGVVSAIFDQAPNTEILWEMSTDTSQPDASVGGCAYRFENRGFNYLASVLPSHREQIFITPGSMPEDCQVQ